MIFKFNGQEHNLPSSLSQITLGQRIAFDVQYGKELDAEKLKVEAMTDPSDKDVESFLLLADNAYKTLSFFSGVDLEELRAGAEIGQVINLYTANLSVLLDEESSLEIEPVYLFEGELWEIAPPADEIPTENVTMKQFQLMKSIVLDLVSLGNGNWDKLPSLCAVYLRKKGETTEQVLSVTEERKRSMLNLPLTIALTVGHYLKDTMSMFMQSLKDFKPEEPEP